MVLSEENRVFEDRSDVERLLDLLAGHERSEAETLDEYRQAVASSPDAGVRFLMKLILEDEERHHGLMAAMAEDVRQSLLWTDGSSPLPQVKATSEAEAGALVQEQTRAFLNVERTGLRRLDDLKKQLKELHADLMELIVEVIEDDTKKHLRILEYIQKHVQPD